jgi:hypothetical protein
MINSGTVITGKIDWLSVTVPYVDYPLNWTCERKELERGMLNYDTGVLYRDGRIELCHSTNSRMKTHIIFDGKCIDNMCVENSINSIDIIAAMSYGKPSRMDIAVDIKNGSLPISSLRDCFRDKTAVTKVKQGLYLEGVGVAGETLYIGSKKAPRRLRIYDKSAETGNIEAEWTRVELQLRHNMANRSFIAINHSDNPIDDIPKLILDFVDFPGIPDWVVAMGTVGMKPSGVEKTQGDREKWLLDTVVKALANEMVMGRKGTALLKEFVDATHREYDKKLSEYKQS